ncbi:PRPF40A [Symbiodinium natans]|uniref:PRPF40A protein n=1 Tax=Symbiodinium natans TaxID=878477 RepID=A0A812IGK4_9DINO|nr:PRPF40A [Symbiodinium natans]
MQLPLQCAVWATSFVFAACQCPLGVLLLQDCRIPEDTICTTDVLDIAGCSTYIIGARSALTLSELHSGAAYFQVESGATVQTGLFNITAEESMRYEFGSQSAFTVSRCDGTLDVRAWRAGTDARVGLSACNLSNATVEIQEGAQIFAFSALIEGGTGSSSPLAVAPTASLILGNGLRVSANTSDVEIYGHLEAGSLTLHCATLLLNAGSQAKCTASKCKVEIVASDIFVEGLLQGGDIHISAMLSLTVGSSGHVNADGLGSSHTAANGQEVGAVVVVTAIAGAVVAARSWRRAWVNIKVFFQHYVAIIDVLLHNSDNYAIVDIFLQPSISSRSAVSTDTRTTSSAPSALSVSQAAHSSSSLATTAHSSLGSSAVTTTLRGVSSTASQGNIANVAVNSSSSNDSSGGFLADSSSSLTTTAHSSLGSSAVTTTLRGVSSTASQGNIANIAVNSSSSNDSSGGFLADGSMPFIGVLVLAVLLTAGSVGAICLCIATRSPRRQTPAPPVYVHPDSTGVPSYWFDAARPASGFRLVKPEQETCKHLSKMLHVTNKTDLDVGYDVVSGRGTYHRKYSTLTFHTAWRVEHPDIWSSYAAKREAIANDVDTLSNQGLVCVPPGVQLPGASALPGQCSQRANEVYLLCGTKPENLHGILAQGLNVRLARLHGMLGSEAAAKVDQYTTPDSGTSISDLGELHKLLFPARGDSTAATVEKHPEEDIFYCLVVRAALGWCAHTDDGEKVMGSVDQNIFHSPEMRELALVPGSSPGVRFHSLVLEKGKRAKRFREFVVYDNSHCYVEYVIAYKRE